MKTPFFKILFLFLGLSTLGQGRALAYHQEVGAPFEEVYQATLKALGKNQIRKESIESLEIESNWFEDVTTRRNRTLIVKTKKKYKRRTKYKITFKAWPRYTEIDIQAQLQYKTYSDSKMAPWRSLKPQRQDIEQEAALFQKILSALTASRVQASAQPVSP